MPNRPVHPQSSAQPIYLTAGLLGLLDLVGIIVMLIAMADVPRQAYYLLISALGLLVVAFTGALAVLLTTNTRRPWGIDPNIGPHAALQHMDERDHDRHASDQLLRHAVQLPDGLGYGRRQSDDTTVVRRLAATPERDERPEPAAPERPSWVSEILPAAFREQPSEPAAEPAEPPLTTIPLDQLELPPIVSNHSAPREPQAGAEL